MISGSRVSSCITHRFFARPDSYHKIPDQSNHHNISPAQLHPKITLSLRSLLRSQYSSLPSLTTMIGVISSFVIISKTSLSLVALLLLLTGSTPTNGLRIPSTVSINIADTWWPWLSIKVFYPMCKVVHFPSRNADFSFSHLGCFSNITVEDSSRYYRTRQESKHDLASSTNQIHLSSEQRRPSCPISKGEDKSRVEQQNIHACLQAHYIERWSATSLLAIFALLF